MRPLEALCQIHRVSERTALGVAGAMAAAIVGVPVRLFLRHGRWSRVSAKDGHVRDSLSSRLSVSKASDI